MLATKIFANRQYLVQTNKTRHVHARIADVQPSVHKTLVASDQTDQETAADQTAAGQGTAADQTAAGQETAADKTGQEIATEQTGQETAARKMHSLHVKHPFPTRMVLH